MSEGLDSLGPLCEVVYQKTGLDLHPYKEKYVRRRVAVRLRATQHSDLAGYVGFLKNDEDELEKLLICLTIHVSSFFRNPSTFDAIRSSVFPELFSRNSSRQRRFWSVGCARGEEPYSLAMLILEYLQDDTKQHRVRIDAVDVDEQVLEDAKRGEFRSSQLKDLDPELARKYFIGNGVHRLVPEIRSMVKFHRRDIFMGETEGDYDFILCRNLLIYIERAPQERILGFFHRALRDGGFLVLGRSEVLVGPAQQLFEVVDAKERIYRKAG